MSTPILATKLYIPPPRPKVVLRPRLIERLNHGLRQKGFGRASGLTLISAPAGFGKTTLVSEWVHQNVLAEGGGKVAWLSLDEGDNDPARFLTYLIAALQTITPNIGAELLRTLHATQPEPPPVESILTALLNEITTVSDHFILILDDYHIIETKPVNQALTFLLEHLSPQLHLVIATREDPPVPLARYRVRGQLTELRAADLRFTPAEAAEFLNQVMGLNLSPEEIAVLETRTEGWIAGLQLAALSMQGHQDTAGFIQSFTGSHRFVMDYLLEEVLHHQPDSVQRFLLRTSILNRLCGPLCEAVLDDPAASGQETLEYLEQANLLIVPLDNERRWYRYHHLFADLLRQRLPQSIGPSTGDEGGGLADYHVRASEWYEENGLALEAFHHAAAAHDVDRAERLIKDGRIPLHARDAVVAILNWLASLPAKVLDARPSLWATYASLSLVAGQTTGVEEKLQAAEAALQRGAQQNAEHFPDAVEALDSTTRNLIGQIAATRATLALTQYQVETMMAQSRRALAYLSADNLPFRVTAIWTLANAYELQGDRAAAGRAYAEAISISEAYGNLFFTTVATIGLGEIQELETKLHLAAETYRRGLRLFGDHPQPGATEAFLGLARIHYQWNELDAAEAYGQQGLRLAQQYDRALDRFIICEIFLVRLQLARGDLAGAAAMLAETAQKVRRHNFTHRMPEVAAAQVLTLLHQGNPAAAEQLVQTHDLPLSQARVYLAQRDPPAALAVLEPWRRQVEARGWQDERLKVMVLQAVTLQAQGEKDRAVQLLSEVLALAEPDGFIRLFVDEGAPMARLLSEALSRGIAPDYIRQLLAAFPSAESQKTASSEAQLSNADLVEPLTERELEVLQLIAEGLTNQEIANRLYLSLNTVKVHTRNIYSKLSVHHRASAVARARALGILDPP